MIPDILKNRGVGGLLNPKSQPQTAIAAASKIKFAFGRPVPTCHHISEAGKRCGSPALRRQRFCYFHKPAQARKAKIVAERARQRWFESVALHDPKAVQNALSEVVDRLANGKIGNHKAGQLLYKLQTAAENLKTARRGNSQIHFREP